MRIIHVHWLPPLSRIIPSWRTTIRTPVPLPPCRIPSRWRGPIRPLPSSSWRRIPIRILIRVSIIIHWYPVCLLFLPISIITALVRVRRGRRILLVTHPSCLVYSAEYHSTRCAQCPSFPDYLYNQSHSFFRASHSPCGSAARQQILRFKHQHGIVQPNLYTSFCIRHRSLFASLTSIQILQKNNTV